MGGRGREGGSRAKPGNQLVYIYIPDFELCLRDVKNTAFVNFAIS